MNPLWPVAKHYIAGESVDEAIEVAKKLKQKGFLTTIDVLGEHVRTRYQSEAVVKEYEDLLKVITRQKLHANISVKLTHLGLPIGTGYCIANLTKLIDNAAKHKSFVYLDMENGEYVQKTIDIYKRVHKHHKQLGIAIQAYLYRSAKDVEELMKIGAHIRLVKGAYKESGARAFPKKKDVDENFKQLMERLLLKGIYPAFATHDEKLIDYAQWFASHNNIQKKKFEFQMLYGIREDLQSQLVNKGYNIRIYVPFGKQWMPYIIRRLRERKENFYFMVKNVAKTEMRNIRVHK